MAGEQYPRRHGSFGATDAGIATRAHRGGSYRRVPEGSGGKTVFGRLGGGSGESSACKTIRSRQWSHGQDRQVGCSGVGRVRAESTAQALREQKRSREAIKCFVG